MVLIMVDENDLGNGFGCCLFYLDLQGTGQTSILYYDSNLNAIRISNIELS